VLYAECTHEWLSSAVGDLLKSTRVRGSVRAHTRHVPTCPHACDADHDDCRCPKWFYVNRDGNLPPGRPSCRSLTLRTTANSLFGYARKNMQTFVTGDERCIHALDSDVGGAWGVILLPDHFGNQVHVLSRLAAGKSYSGRRKRAPTIIEFASNRILLDIRNDPPVLRIRSKCKWTL
jgi:hypothetical protein